MHYQFNYIKYDKLMNRVATFFLIDVSLITITYISMEIQYVSLSGTINENENSVDFGRIQKMILTETLGVISLSIFGNRLFIYYKYFFLSAIAEWDFGVSK